MKIAVISDIHSAADHFADALKAAREEGFDQLVVLGDLLTYGPDPVETLDIAHEAASRDRAIFITGNHDLLYLQEPGNDAYVSRLPDWIRESVNWTCAKLDSRSPMDQLPWQSEWEQSGILFSHANPFGVGDWSYLNDEKSLMKASAALQERSLRWGVFGHVHRFHKFSGKGTWVATVGSIGQPRDATQPSSQWALVSSGEQVSIEQRNVSRSWTETVARIHQSSLSDTTKERLCRFYR